MEDAWGDAGSGGNLSQSAARTRMRAGTDSHVFDHLRVPLNSAQRGPLHLSPPTVHSLSPGTRLAPLGERVECFGSLTVPSRACALTSGKSVTARHTA